MGRTPAVGPVSMVITSPSSAEADSADRSTPQTTSGFLIEVVHMTVVP